MSPGVSKTAFRLRISLKEYVPVIWRRLLVPGGVTMAKLHTIFQTAMGWENYHLHCFEIDGVRYGIPDPEFEMTDIDDETVRLSEVVGERARFEYQYDFGDNWCHEVIIESVARWIWCSSSRCVSKASGRAHPRTSGVLTCIRWSSKRSGTLTTRSTRST